MAAALVVGVERPRARPPDPRRAHLLVAPRQPPRALPLALPRRAPPRPHARQHERAALPLRRGSALGGGASGGDPHARDPARLGARVRDAGAHRRDLPSLEPAAPGRFRARAQPRDRDALHPLGASPPRPRGHGLELRDRAEPLGSALPLALARAAYPRPRDRRRGPRGITGAGAGGGAVSVSCWLSAVSH